MENMDKEPTVPKWVLINQPKTPQIFRPNLSAQAQKFGVFEKKLSLGVRIPWLCRFSHHNWYKAYFNQKILHC